MDFLDDLGLIGEMAYDHTRINAKINSITLVPNNSFRQKYIIFT